MTTMTRSRMLLGLGLIMSGVLSLSVTLAPAIAAPVTFQFSGQLTSLIGGGLTAAGFSVGQSFVGSYTFESTSSNVYDANPNKAIYNALTSLTATIGSYTVTLVPDPDLREIQIHNNLGSSISRRDAYIVGSRVTGAVVNGLSPVDFFIDLIDPSHTAFDSDALPSSPPNLSSFATKRASFGFFSGAPENSLLHGEIHSLTAVPVPAAVLLFGTGLTALIGLGAGSWRRKQIRGD